MAPTLLSRVAATSGRSVAAKLVLLCRPVCRYSAFMLNVQSIAGASVHLTPLNLEVHAAGLYAAAQGEFDDDELIWRYLSYGPFSSAQELRAQYERLMALPKIQFMCVEQQGRPVGVAAFMSDEPEHRKIELGHIWYAPPVQRTRVNTETIALMLQHVFDAGYQRVEWKCNALNERSRAAALRLGFRFEGVQEAHMIVKGKSRDTAWFRILAREWPEVREQLQKKLA
jgi:RimJ/RimL family protein N-acetyltransferase